MNNACVVHTAMAAVCGTSMRCVSSWNICVGWQCISHGNGARPFDAESIGWPAQCQQTCLYGSG